MHHDLLETDEETRHSSGAHPTGTTQENITSSDGSMDNYIPLPEWYPADANNYSTNEYESEVQDEDGEQEHEEEEEEESEGEGKFQYPWEAEEEMEDDEQWSHRQRRTIIGRGEWQ